MAAVALPQAGRVATGAARETWGVHNSADDSSGNDESRSLDEARDDPRLHRKRGAMIGDFQLALDEAERMRELATWGIHELTRSVERTEAELGVSRTDPELAAEHGAELRAAWQRAEIAKSEETNEYPHLHASALVAMVSALDAMVEELVPAFREFLVDLNARHLVDRIAELGPLTLDDHDRDETIAVLREVLAAKLPPSRPPKGKGSVRYEASLEKLGLAAPPDRPIPVDLDAALTEIGVLRDVLVHRAGRLDDRGLSQAPTLRSRYEDGDFIRINRADYRRYSAAIRCYGAEIARRAMLGLWDGSDDDVDLATWRNWHRVNA